MKIINIFLNQHHVRAENSSILSCFIPSKKHNLCPRRGLIDYPQAVRDEDQDENSVNR